MVMVGWTYVYISYVMICIYIYINIILYYIIFVFGKNIPYLDTVPHPAVLFLPPSGGVRGTIGPWDCAFAYGITIAHGSRHHACSCTDGAGQERHDTAGGVTETAVPNECLHIHIYILYYLKPIPFLGCSDMHVW